jgi:hypothetical protein
MQPHLRGFEVQPVADWLYKERHTKTPQVKISNRWYSLYLQIGVVAFAPAADRKFISGTVI